MAHILVVDDEDKIRMIIRKYGEFEGHKVTEAKDGIEAVQLCTNHDFDVIILDVMMPLLDGFSTCKQIRKYKRTPVIMLSARGEEYDKIHGFELGIDDYVVKPFSPKELMMRVNVVVTRNARLNTPIQREMDLFIAEGLIIDFKGRSVKVDGKNVDMTPKEYELLFYLVRNRNIALTREKLITNIWGYDYIGDERTLDTHIKMLRNSLGKYRRFLVTLRGVGYRFENI
ncbi:MAG: response regulator transcription factor [Lachnospiraceae bacterium]